MCRLDDAPAGKEMARTDLYDCLCVVCVVQDLFVGVMQLATAMALSLATVNHPSLVSHAVRDVGLI
jgi:hypothetical protein